MKQLRAFMNKEFMECIRSGKMLILLILFVLFGMMNPAIAKLTPWMMEMMSDRMGSTGLAVTAVEVNALTSWTQFYKNIPLLLIIFLLLFSGILTTEYQKGTLINMITKGMKRWKIIASKEMVILLCWTAGYWLCYGITYGYTDFFWDNSVLTKIWFPALCLYLLGVWLITVILLLSTIFRSSSSVLVMALGIFAVVYLLGLLPALSSYMPVRLMESTGLLTGIEGADQYLTAIIAVLLLSLGNTVASIICFNRSEI